MVKFGHHPVSFALENEPIPDACPLTSWEKQRKLQLEAVVEAGLGKFLQTGQALAEIRNRRLYRVEFASFESYVQARFGMHRSAVDSVIRSAQVAQVLLDSGLELPSDTNPTSLRAVSALPGDDSLKSACWQLAQRLSPARAPSQPLVSKLCRMVTNCLEDCGQNGQDGESGARSGFHQPRQREPLQRETPFVRPVLRLARWHGFSPEVVVAHIARTENARILFSACNAMILRCRAVQERLITRFPDMEGHLVEYDSK
jgi:hypothetical protein